MNGGLNPDLRHVFLRGYRSLRSLPESSYRAVEAYALVGMVSYYAYQIDNPYIDSSSNGLTYVVERFKEESIAGHITLVKGERSDLAELAATLL